MTINRLVIESHGDKVFILKNGWNRILVMYILYNKMFINILSEKTNYKIEYSSISFLYAKMHPKNSVMFFLIYW